MQTYSYFTIKPQAIIETIYKLFTKTITSPPRLEYESVQRDRTCEWSCQSLAYQTPDHIFFHVLSNEYVYWFGPGEKSFYGPISFPDGMPEVDPIPSKCCPGATDNLIFACFCNSMKTLSLYIRISLPL